MSGFFDLPAELQLETYKHILADVTEKSSPRELAPYASLLLSCKEIYSNFEYKWVKNFNEFLPSLVADAVFRILLIKSFSDAVHIRIVRTTRFRWLHPNVRHHPDVRHVVKKLISTFRRFTVRLDDIFKPTIERCSIPLSASNFRLQCGVLWEDWSMGEEDNPYGWPRHMRDKLPLTLCRVDYWKLELHVMVRAFDGPPKEEDESEYDSESDSDVNSEAALETGAEEKIEIDSQAEVDTEMDAGTDAEVDAEGRTEQRHSYLFDIIRSRPYYTKERYDPRREVFLNIFNSRANTEELRRYAGVIQSSTEYGGAARLQRSNVTLAVL